MSRQTIVSITDLLEIKTAYNEELAKYRCQILVCSGAGCISSVSYTHLTLPTNREV